MFRRTLSVDERKMMMGYGIGMLARVAPWALGVTVWLSLALGAARLMKNAAAAYELCPDTEIERLIA